jgi:hypothetical protein
MKARLAFKAAVPEEVVINGPVGGGEAQTRGKSVLEVLADEFGVGLFGFHDEIREMNGVRSEDKDATQEKLRAHSRQLTARAKTKMQHREHRGPSTENTEKEVDNRRPELGNQGRKEKAPARDALPDSGQAGAAKWARYRIAAGNLGYGGPKKETPRKDRSFYMS